MNNPQTVEEKAETEEWGAWKFVSDMLYNPDVSGIYPTSKCYEQIHDFVVEQKHGDRLAHKTALLEAIGNYDTKEHICGFNDGDCDCECFLAALDTIKDLINTWA